MKKHLLLNFTIIYILFSIAGNTVFSQETKIRGRVTDEKTGEGLPFVGIFFKGTTIGISTDMDGYYSLSTKDKRVSTLCAFLLGYDSMEKNIKPGVFNEVNFKLKLTENMISASTVKPDDRYLKSILKKIDANRERHNPDKIKKYKCNTYNKIELDLTNPHDNLTNKTFVKNFGFVFDYTDTSSISGKPYLPVMISETISTRYKEETSGIDKEVIEAQKISGLNSTNSISEFTGSLLLKTNFYNSYINTFNVELPSPLASSGELYYNYFLIDSLNISGRKTYFIRFHPKKYVSSPCFDGEMHIDAEDYGLESIHVKVPNSSNINWIKDISISVENQRINDSVWFNKQDKLYAEFTVALKDSSKMASFIGNRELNYYNISFDSVRVNPKFNNRYSVQMTSDATEKSAEFWDKARPYDLSEKERNIYKMVDEVKDIPLYKDIYSIINTIVTGYYEHGKIGLGPISSLTSYSNLEGRRVHFGIRTTKEFSRKIRLGVYGAYGFGDRKFKGGMSFEYVRSKMPLRKFTFKAKHDVIQLGQGNSLITESNILASIFAKNGGKYMKRNIIDELKLQYEHEYSYGILQSFEWKYLRFYSNRFVPMITQDGKQVEVLPANYFSSNLRLSYNESVSRGAFDRKTLFTKYPIVNIEISGGLKGISDNEYDFAKAEISFSWKPAIPPLGYTSINLNAGKIFGKVPYPLLKIHEGNGSYFFNKTAFACMEYFEFASDTWVGLMMEHNFYGFFLGKIPLIRKMNLREIISLKMVYGTLSDKNNGRLKDSFLIFPEGMSELKTPYVEVGAGITNIFKILRVDCFWRLTHKEKYMDGTMVKAPHLFALNFGLELRF